MTFLRLISKLSYHIPMLTSSGKRVSINLLVQTTSAQKQLKLFKELGDKIAPMMLQLR